MAKSSSNALLGKGGFLNVLPGPLDQSDSEARVYETPALVDSVKLVWAL